MKRIYYDNEKECKEHNKYTVNDQEINIRYKNFNHTIFTAGDVEQFYDKCGEINNDINNTFLYLFHKFKKGIFVRIKDNKVNTFLPFSKKNFINEWSHLVKITNNYSHFSNNRYNKNMDGIMNFISSKTKFRKMKWLYDMDLWYSNNCLIRNENPIYEGESGVLEIKDMLDNLCNNRKINDVYFFINKRDFPLIKFDRTEPYDCIYGDNTPLLSHNYKHYCKILSMTTSDNFEDIAIPTWDDWCRISSKHNKFFPRNCKNYNYNFVTNWSSKISKAVFRGASTGSGTTEHTNMRLKISLNTNNLIDAGITKWNLRPRLNRISDQAFLDVINNTHLPPLKNFLTPEEQSNYKYIINIDGHSSAFRLSLEMSMGSVILLVDSKYKLWFRNLMKEYVHYVPIKADLSDIDEKLDWCIKNDKQCEIIAKNSIDFYNKYLLEDNIYNYLQNIINNISCKSLYPVYNNYKFDNLFNVNNTKKSELICNFTLPREYSYQKSFSKYLRNFNNDNFIHLSTNKNISLYNNNKFYYILKENYTTLEAHIGINYINNLYKRIPNFMFTYKCTKQYLYLEYIKGIEFQTWLKDSFDINKYIFIILQITLAIQVAQEDCNFIHFDLSPWNIILYEYPQEIEVLYQLKHSNTFIKLKTKLVPVIIDYGKSSANNLSVMSTSKQNFMFDIVSLLTKSINTILLNNITDYVFSKLLILFYFFKDISPTFSNIFSFRKFVKTRSKYDNLLNFCNLSFDKTILDFFHYLNTNFSLPFIIIDNAQINTSDYYYFNYCRIINKRFDFVNLHNNFPIGSTPFNSIYIYNKIYKILINNNLSEEYITKIHNFYKIILNDFKHIKYSDQNKDKLFDLITSPLLSKEFKQKFLCN